MFAQNPNNKFWFWLWWFVAYLFAFIFMVTGESIFESSNLSGIGGFVFIAQSLFIIWRFGFYNRPRLS